MGCQDNSISGQQGDSNSRVKKLLPYQQGEISGIFQMSRLTSLIFRPFCFPALLILFLLRLQICSYTANKDDQIIAFKVCFKFKVQKTEKVDLRSESKKLNNNHDAH